MNSIKNQSDSADKGSDNDYIPPKDNDHVSTFDLKEKKYSLCTPKSIFYPFYPILLLQGDEEECEKEHEPPVLTPKGKSRWESFRKVLFFWVVCV